MISEAHEHTQATVTLLNEAPSQELRNNTDISSFSGDFPICTDLNGPIAPFCLPKDGADVTADATYYVTWNADFYPLNATITIELRYANSSQGDSAFTSEKTDNSYGYISLPMQKEWLQGKPYNALTLYIIELDPRRAAELVPGKAQLSYSILNQLNTTSLPLGHHLTGRLFLSDFLSALVLSLLLLRV